MMSMQVLARELHCDSLYKLILSWSVVSDIVSLMKSYKPIDRKTFRLKDIDRLIYVVFADCLGDVSDYSSSDAFFNVGMRNFIFVDPYSHVNQWTLISHELIHYFQSYLYASPKDSLTDVWVEAMAKRLQEPVREMICSEYSKNMIFRFVTDLSKDIEDFIDYKCLGSYEYLDEVYAFEGNFVDVCHIECI
jgi:hypothetical protein